MIWKSKCITVSGSSESPNLHRLVETVEVAMVTEKKDKCAHPACRCLARDGGKYCSQYCEDAQHHRAFVQLRTCRLRSVGTCGIDPVGLDQAQLLDGEAGALQIGGLH